MRKFYKNLKTILTIIVLSLIFSLTLSVTAFAATTPSLGTAGTFGLLSNTFNYNGGLTSITGDLGYSGAFPGGGASLFVSGSTQPNNAAWTAAGIAQNNALSTGLNNLNGQACTYSFPAGAIDLAADTTHGTIGVYTPGVYCITGAVSIGTAGITLNGSGTYIFRSTGALGTVDNSHVLSAGASSCDVFWTPGAATTLGANTSFFGTVIDSSGITVGHLTSWIGRALAYGGTITTDTNTFTSTCTIGSDIIPIQLRGGRPTGTIKVTKVVINDNGGAKIVADFPLFVDDARVMSGEINDFTALNDVHTVTEISDSHYTSTFSGDCDASGKLILHSGDNKSCTITNNDIGPVAVLNPTPTPIVVTPAPVAIVTPIPVVSSPVLVVVPAVIPTFPQTGFPPEKNNISYYISWDSLVNFLDKVWNIKYH